MAAAGTGRGWRGARRRGVILALACCGWTLGAQTAAAHGQPLTGFLSEPVEQLALPGAQASAEITPEGDVYTGWAEYEMFVGPHLRRWAQPTRVLSTPARPEFRSSMLVGKVSYTQRIFTIPVAGRPTVYLSLTARDLGAHPQSARSAMALAYTRGRMVTGFHGVPTGVFRYERPATAPADGYFFALGAAFGPDWSYSVQGRDVIRDGALLLRGPSAATAVPTPAVTGPEALHAEMAYRRRLAPQQSVTWTWQIPLQPPAAGASADRSLDDVDATAAERVLADFWRRQERGMTHIHVPEQRVDDVYDASALAILQARYLTPSGWVQGVNRLQYQAYWIRDSAVETVALDQIGLHAAAGENLGFLGHWQQPDGLYISRAGQQDGVGQALWELAEHARLTQSPRFATSRLGGAGAAVGWIARVSAQDPRGLLPPSTIADDEFLTGSRITGDNVWAAVGLRSAVLLADLARRPDLAADWRAIDVRFEAALRRALRQADARAGHIPPGLGGPGGNDWGNYGVDYPAAIVDVQDPEISATLRYARAHAREGLATYGGQLHDYLEFPIDETELEAGDVADALQGFYAELVHTTAPGFGWEDGPWPYGGRESTTNLSPHGTFAGQFVSLLRDLLVRDEGGDGVELLPGVSPAWMRPGDTISVSGAPTVAGPLSLRLSVAPSGSGATLHWWTRRPISSLYWELPYWVHRATGPDGRRVTGRERLHGRSGSLTLAWSARLPALSAAGTGAALDRAYLAHGRPAPIVPAPGW
jgi:hypothetical protein